MPPLANSLGDFFLLFSTELCQTQIQTVAVISARMYR